MSFILGLTGGIATGKSAADDFFRKKGIPVIDADQVAHHVYDLNKPAWRELKQVFGKEYLNADQTVNRQKLGDLVFHNPQKLELLNQITHPFIYQEIMARIADLSNQKLVVVDMPVLFESNGAKICDRILVVSLPESVQLTRLMKRNNLDKEQALARIHSQMPLAQKEKKADYVVDNSGTLIDLANSLTKVLEKIQSEV